MIRADMPVSHGVGLVMDVLRRMLRPHDQSFDLGRAEMENAGLAMIDPDDGVVVMSGHVCWAWV